MLKFLETSDEIEADKIFFVIGFRAVKIWFSLLCKNCMVALRFVKITIEESITPVPSTIRQSLGHQADADNRVQHKNSLGLCHDLRKIVPDPPPTTEHSDNILVKILPTTRRRRTNTRRPRASGIGRNTRRSESKLVFV